MRCPQCGDIPALVMTSGLCYACELDNEPSCLGCGVAIDPVTDGEVCDTCWNEGAIA